MLFVPHRKCVYALLSWMHWLSLGETEPPCSCARYNMRETWKCVRQTRLIDWLRVIFYFWFPFVVEDFPRLCKYLTLTNCHRNTSTMCWTCATIWRYGRSSLATASRATASSQSISSASADEISQNIWLKICQKCLEYWWGILLCNMIFIMLGVQV